jgi:aspartate ammonia-lyase
MAAFSGSLREFALELIRIANDLRLMNSGPSAGFDEIVLPPVQPGSSIMPGKVNPVMAECADMIGFQIVGNDTVVALAAQAGQFELNVMTPVMVQNILESIALLNHYLPVFTRNCIDGITANEPHLARYIGTNPILATLLVPRIGHMKAAEIARESMVTHRRIRDIAVERGILTEAEAERIFGTQELIRNRFRDDEGDGSDR